VRRLGALSDVVGQQRERLADVAPARQQAEEDGSSALGPQQVARMIDAEQADGNRRRAVDEAPQVLVGEPQRQRPPVVREFEREAGIGQDDEGGPDAVTANA